jgi:hypothetical protein
MIMIIIMRMVIIIVVVIDIRIVITAAATIMVIYGAALWILNYCVWTTALADAHYFTAAPQRGSE